MVADFQLSFLQLLCDILEDLTDSCRLRS